MRRAHQLAPDNFKILEALAEAEFHCGYPIDALPLWELLQQVRPSDTHIVLRKGEILSRLGFLDRSIPHSKPHWCNPPIQASCGWRLLKLGKTVGIGKRPSRPSNGRWSCARLGAFPLSNLLSLQRGQAPQSLIDSATTLLASASLSNHDRSLAGYELGKALDAKGEYATALLSWANANAARRRMTGPYDPEELELKVEQAIGNTQTSLLARSMTGGNQDPRFVFIVGMPRSGTTLTEQILAAHPLAFGCGELPDMAFIARDLE